MKNNRNYLILLSFLIYGEALSADTLGRLFLTPEQRTQLEAARAQRDRRLPGPEPEAAPVAKPQTPEIITYSGVVRRSDGKSTVWINGRPVNERNHAQAENEISITAVQRDGAVSVAIPQADRRASLKVGQSLAVESGVIEESYLRRETIPRPAVNAPAAATPAVPSTTSAAATAPAPTKQVPTAASDVNALATRPVRPSDRLEADPESGAASAVRAAL